MTRLYALHKTIFSFGGDAWIEDDQGNRVFEVDGKAFALGRTLDLRDPSGAVLVTLRAPVLTIAPKFEMTHEGETVATIEKALFTFFGSKFTITLAGGGELQAEGDFLDHEYRVVSGDTEVIGASRAWFSLHDTFGVRIAEDFDQALGLAIVIAIEEMERAARQD